MVLALLGRSETQGLEVRLERQNKINTLRNKQHADNPMTMPPNEKRKISAQDYL